MTRKELALKLATIQKARLNLSSSVESLAKGYLFGRGYMKPYTKEELEKAIESQSN